MADDHDRAVDHGQQLDGRRDAFGVAGLGIVQRQVRRHHGVPAGAQLDCDVVPARAVMPGSVEQAEGGHRAIVS
jgi:hypothetical protein